MSDLVLGENFQDQNRGFAYHVLNAVLEANDGYMFLSGGDHMHDAGVELYISTEIAKALVMRKVVLDGIETEFAMLEATGYRLFGDRPSSRRFDIGLARRDDPPRDPLEVFGVIEVKRHFNDSKNDILKLAEILEMHRDEGWSVKRAALVGVDTRYEATRKSTTDRLADYMSDIRSKHPKLIFEIATLTRDNVLNIDPREKFKNSRVRTFVAHCIILRLVN